MAQSAAVHLLLQGFSNITAVWGEHLRAGFTCSHGASEPCHRVSQCGLSHPDAAAVLPAAVPISPGRCRAIVRNMFLFKSPIPRLVFKIVPVLFSHIGKPCGAAVRRCF